MDFNAILKFINNVLHFHLFELYKTLITPSSIVMCNGVIAIFLLRSMVLRATNLCGIPGKFRIDLGTKYNLNRVIN
jgi:hypothetical protein